MVTRRVYSELLPYADLVRPRTLGLLSRYGLELVLAVRPWDEPALPDVARALRDAGVPLSIWPMLSDDRGRWASVHNAEEFSRLALSVCDALEAVGARPRDLLFDLEPPFAQARALAALGAARTPSPEGRERFASGLGRPSTPVFEAASQVLSRAVGEIHARGIATSLAVWPLVALDPPGERAWQSVLGTPVDALGTGHVSHVSVMVYTSILEGWSRGALRRRHTTALLAAAAARTVRRWGPQAGISLGCVGTGAFHDEPTYRDPSELAEDAAIARASGCAKLTLFDLGGVLSREPAEAWLDAFASSGEAPALPASRRVHAARRIARAVTWALGWPRRRGPR
jgi:hypothetical protein